MSQDPFWVVILLAVHVTAGLLCLVFAPLALLSVKGGPSHRRWGKYYFAAVSMMTATALVLASYRPRYFLAMIAVLSFYLAFSGYRALTLKARDDGAARAVDWIAAGAASIACAGLVALGLYPLASGGSAVVVPVILGLLGLRATGGDLVRFARGPAHPLSWLNTHLGHFIASYIAALTAFSVVTLPRLFPDAGVVLWLWPAALGVPLIYIAGAYYRRKFTVA